MTQDQNKMLVLSVRPGSCPAATTKYFIDEGRPRDTLSLNTYTGTL